MSATDVGEALRAGGRLERIGLVENLISEHSITDLADLMKVSEKLPPVLMREYRDRAELMAVFTRPASKSGLRSGDFGFVGDDVQVLVQLLRKAQQTQAVGVNVLLYGPPGTGKTELAKVVAREAGLSLFEVEYADRDGNSLSGRDRYRSMQIAQVFLKGAHEAALLFDEVEDVFPPISVDAAGLMARAEQQALSAAVGHSVNGKAWVNQILETNPVPVVWITNRIEQIDPAFRRRFQYHLELKSPPPGAREALVLKALQGVAVAEGFAARLAERKGLTPAQVRTAVKFARLAGVDAGEGGVDGAASASAGTSPPLSASRAKRTAVRICAGVSWRRSARRAVKAGLTPESANARVTIASRAPGGGDFSSKWYWKRRRNAGSICSMRLVTQITGTGLLSRIWLTQALPLTLPLMWPAPPSLLSSRAISCAASLRTGGNTASTSSNSNATSALPLRNTWLICRLR